MMSPKRHDSFDLEAYIDGKEPDCALPKDEIRALNPFGCTDYVKSKAFSLYKKAEKLPLGKEISLLDEESLLDILQDVSLLSMSVREGILGYKDTRYPARRKQLLQALPVLVSIPENAILRVSMPPLVGRKITGAYDIYQQVKLALEDFMSTREFPAYFGKKLLLIYKKYAQNLGVCYTCDNDNWEAKRTTNAISEALNYSDNAEHFSMMYTAVKSTANYVEATLIPIESLQYFLPYLTDATPAQPP